MTSAYRWATVPVPDHIECHSEQLLVSLCPPPACCPRCRWPHVSAGGYWLHCAAATVPAMPAPPRPQQPRHRHQYNTDPVWRVRTSQIIKHHTDTLPRPTCTYSTLQLSVSPNSVKGVSRPSLLDAGAGAGAGRRYEVIRLQTRPQTRTLAHCQPQPRPHVTTRPLNGDQMSASSQQGGRGQYDGYSLPDTWCQWSKSALPRPRPGPGRAGWRQYMESQTVPVSRHRPGPIVWLVVLCLEFDNYDIDVYIHSFPKFWRKSLPELSHNEIGTLVQKIEYQFFQR